MQEELIAAKIAQEAADETVSSLKEELAILRDQSELEERNRIEMENKLTENMNKLRYIIYEIADKYRFLMGYRYLERTNWK